MRRVSKQAEVNNITYPLIDLFPSDKQDVLDWWEDQEFDLGIEEWNGNCKGCYKKSYKKLFKQLDEDAHSLDFHLRMEEKYPQTGNSVIDSKNRVFFRGNLSAIQVLNNWKEDRETGATVSNYDKYLDGGCSESCEVYMTE